MEQLTQVRLRVGDRLWDFNISVNLDWRLVVEPVEWEEFHRTYPEGITVEVFDYTYVINPFV